MEKEYDLFELLPGAFPQWIGSANDLPEVRKKIESLPAPPSGGQYLARQFRSGTVVAYTVPAPQGTTVFPPAADPRDPTKVLTSELRFLTEGGYGSSGQTDVNSKLIFRDSPTCINFGGCNRTRACEKCLLLEFVPPAARAKTLPCHQIPLNAQGDTVASLTETTSRVWVERAVERWLKATLARLEGPSVRSARTQKQPSHGSQAAHESGPRVLIVDDDGEVLLTLKRALQDAGYGATTAWSGRQGLRLLRESSFDLVFLDHNLPDLSSEEVLRQLRDITATTPTVVMHATDLSDEDAVRLRRLGACFFVKKERAADLAAIAPSCARAAQCAVHA